MNQSMPAVQKCLGKIAFLLFGHTITEKCFYATCTANQNLKSPQKKNETISEMYNCKLAFVCFLPVLRRKLPVLC